MPKSHNKRVAKAKAVEKAVAAAPTLCVGDIWQCREPLITARCFSRSEGKAFAILHYNGERYGEKYYDTKFVGLGCFRPIGETRATTHDLVKKIGTFEIPVLPAIKIGQIWQCRKQEYTAKIVNRYGAAAWNVMLFDSEGDEYGNHVYHPERVFCGAYNQYVDEVSDMDLVNCVHDP